MADPMSIISTVAVAAHAVHKAKNFIDSIKGAPDVVKQLSADLKTLEKPLQDLGRLSQNTQNFNAFSREELSQSLHPALSSCQEASNNIERFLFQYVRPDGVPNRNVWKRLSFGFKESKVALLQTQLGASKGSLIVAVGYANLWMQTQHSKQTQKIDQGVSKIQRQNRRIQRHFDIETSSVAESEYITIGERSNFKHDIRQWLSQTQSVIEEEQHDERDTANEHDDADDEDTFFNSTEENNTWKTSIFRNQQAAEQYAQNRQHLRGILKIPPVFQSQSKIPVLQSQTKMSKESKPIGPIEVHGSISKQIVSREALLKHGIHFKDDGEPTVRIIGSIGADTLDRLADLSIRLAPNKSDWWLPQAFENSPKQQIPALRTAFTVQNQTCNVSEVSKEALKKLGMIYRVYGYNVIFQEWTDQATVERAMDLSRRLEPDRSKWWP